MKFQAIRVAVLAVSVFDAAAFAAVPVAVNSDPMQMDANKDGKITAEEHVAASARMFTAMDANKDGKVTAKEMEVAHQKVTGKPADPTELSAQEKIKAIDMDDDGALTAAEHAAGSQLLFTTMDTNKDGSLSKAELEEGRKLLKKPAK